jgi:hypothetical protein
MRRERVIRSPHVRRSRHGGIDMIFSSVVTAEGAACSAHAQVEI